MIQYYNTYINHTFLQHHHRLWFVCIFDLNRLQNANMREAGCKLDSVTHVSVISSTQDKSRILDFTCGVQKSLGVANIDTGNIDITM